MNFIVVLAGFDVDIHDKIRSRSSKRFVQTGSLIIKPHSGPYSPAYSNALLEAARVAARSLPEAAPTTTIVVGVDKPDVQHLMDAFFPFALVRRVPALDRAPLPRPASNARIADYIDRVEDVVIECRRRAGMVTDKTSVGNMSPLLLPIENFADASLRDMISDLYQKLGEADDVDGIIREATEAFIQKCPHTKPPDGQRRCFSDGQHYFKSPGNDRHGYYRHKDDHGHGPACLLRARSRLGGAYDYRFHFDVQPVRKLDASYPSCHGQMLSPKENHVNIAPNDGVI